MLQCSSQHLEEWQSELHYCNNSLPELATGQMLLQGELPQVATPPHPCLTKGVQAGLYVQPHVQKVHPLEQSCINMGFVGGTSRACVLLYVRQREAALGCRQSAVQTACKHA